MATTTGGGGGGLRIFGVILVLFTIRDLISMVGPGHSATPPSEDIVSADTDDFPSEVEWKAEKGGPGSKISSAKFIGPTIKILYCSSGGYQNAFEQYSQFIQEKYPEISVEGSSYPLPPLRRTVGQLLTALKFLVLGAMLMNQWSIFRLAGIPERAIAWICDNKIYASLLFFFLLNLVETQVASTGAFEMYIDDVPVWSNVQTGRLPNPPELVQIIDNHMKFGGNAGPAFQLPPS